MKLLAQAVLATLAVHAQLTDATLSGTVRDATGANVSGADITAFHVPTGQRFNVKTNADGFYSLRPIPTGAYQLTAELTGFRRFQQDGLVLSTGQSAEIEITLQPGNVTESVVVTGEAPLLETRSQGATQLIESKMIEDMPMGDRRAFNMLEITGNTVFVPNETGGSPSFALGGGRVGSQMYWIDGGAGQNIRIGVPGSNLDPPIESLSEVRILTNGFSAEYGASAGGVIVLNTKSGGNKWRGSLFEYFRNQVLDAPNFFSPTVGTEKQRPALRYNVFGGTAGGRLKRDRTFIFMSHEASIRGDGAIRNLTVPSRLERQGNFSESVSQRGILSPIYDPYTGFLEGTTLRRAVFPNNIIPPSRFDRIAGGLVDFFPLPNKPPDDRSGANNFRQNDVNKRNRQNFMVKLDHAFREQDKVTFRYLFTLDNSYRTSVYPNPVADTINQSDGNAHFYYGSWIKIVSPSIINELRFTYQERTFHSYSRGLGEGWPTKLGFRGLNDDAFPNFAPAGYAQLGSTSQERRQFPIRQFQIVESVSWIRGKQTWKFGGELRPSMNRDVLRATVSGRFTFNRGLTGIPGNANTGNGFATMLLGLPALFESRETDELQRRTWYGAAYAQNDWDVRRNLTVNFGVRWEVDTPLADINNAMNGFDANAINPVSGTPGVVRFACRNGYRCNGYNADWNNFGPRVGFAWTPKALRKTVVRGGFGVFFAHPFDRSLANAASLGFERSGQTNLLDNATDLPYTLARNLPIPDLTARPLDDRFGAVRPGATATQAVTYIEENRRSGYSLQPNLRIQHELPGQILLDWGYLGNLSRKLAGSNLNTNQIRPELVTTAASQALRPFPQFSQVTILAPAFGVSSYHAGSVRVEKRFSRGFNLLSTYTWSKTLDNVDSLSGNFGNETNSFSNFYNRRADWGPSEIDITHRVTFSSVYQIPIGKRRRYLKKNPARHVLGDWSIGTVFSQQTGGPITITTLTNNTFAFSAGPQRADIVRNPNLPNGQRGIFRWFDTEAFAQPAPGLFGNQGVGQVRGPGVVSWNASLIRTFPLGEGKLLHFRGEMQNLPNTPNFNLPGNQYEGPGYGIINAARPARQVQLGMRITF